MPGWLRKCHDLHFLGVKRLLQADGNVGNFRNQDREQQHVRGIDLPDPPQDARGRNLEAGLEHRTAVNERRGVARDENEDFGGVAESVTADREPGQDVGRYVIDEDQPERQAAKQIQPQFAHAGWREAKAGSRAGAACAIASAAPTWGGPATRSEIDVISPVLRVCCANTYKNCHGPRFAPTPSG